MNRLKIIVIGVMLWAQAGESPAWADENLSLQIAQLTESVRALTLRVERQDAEISRLNTGGIQDGQSLASFRNASPAPSAGPLQGRWNPDIGVVGDIVSSFDSSKSDEEGADRVSVREFELAFGSPVDPYTRMDATLGISDFENMELEEAYVTRFGLPLDWTARVGRFLPKIGKAIPAHRDSLDTVDEPLVIEKYFGHHGYNRTGLDLSRPIELPWSVSHEVTWGVLEGGNGEEGTLFGETRRHPTLYTHFKNYADLNDTTGTELGFSYLTGSRDEDSSFEVNVLGVDGTLTHRYADQRHIKIQSEGYLVHRAESYYLLEDKAAGTVYLEDLDDARHLWGSYALGDWRFDPRWAAGVRCDNVQLIETSENFANPRQTERGASAYLTFYQSEFARWRIQYSHLNLTDGQEDNRVFVQGTFAIGEHEHKLS